MRIVLDTNVLVRGHARATGPAREVVRRVTSGPHLFLITSPFILEELERALHYPRLQTQWPLTEEEIQAYVAELDRSAEVLETGEATPGEALSPDPKDDPVIQTAKLGRANVLCTLDRHIRNSRKVRAYCAKHAIQILTDVELLRVLRQAAQEA